MDDDVKDALDALTSQIADLKGQVDQLTQTLTGVNNLVTEDGTKMNEIERLSTRIDGIQDEMAKAADAAKEPSGEATDAASKLDDVSKKVDAVEQMAEQIKTYINATLVPGLASTPPGMPIVVSTLN